MRKQFIISFLIAWQCMAQTPFVREGSIGQSPSQSNSKQKGLATLEIKDWIGQKFILLPKSKKLQSYGYQAFNPALPYDKWVGKILTVTEVSGKDFLPEITFRSEDGKKLLTKAYSKNVASMAPLRDLEYARSNWLGKTFWLRGNTLATWDEANQTFGSVKLKKYSPVIVEDVVAGWYNNSPIRLILKSDKGEIGYLDVNFTGTNISEVLREHSRFSDKLLEQDPRTTWNWPPEIWTAIEDAKVTIGMTSEQALMSWGKPKSINRTVTSRGTEEQWVYGVSTYLYIQEGKVTAAQN